MPPTGCIVRSVMQLTAIPPPTTNPGGLPAVAGVPSAGWIIRELTSADRAGVIAAFDSLSDETRQRRYLGHRHSLGEEELDRIVGLDPHVPAALAAVDPAGRVIGVGRVGVDPAEPAVAHLGIVVGDAWQGRGIGRELFRAVCRHAAAAGLRTMRVTTLSDNQPVLHLLDGAHARDRHWLGGGILEAEIPLPVSS